MGHQEAHPENRQWVLGFDGGCLACNSIAQRVIELSDGRVLAASLQWPFVRQWRERALGADAPWRPTLFAVEGEQVRAWTGPAMAWKLGKLLGFRNSWEVL